jgi:flagellar M-ring protein FliF
MEFLNKATSQLSDLFKSMTPGARITAGMLLVLIATSLAYLFLSPGGGGYQYLGGGRVYSPEDIQKMASAFAEEHLDDFDPDGNRMRVPKRKLSVYQQALNKAGFTPTDVDSPMKAIKSGSGSFWESEKEKEFRRSLAQQEQLSLIIQERDDIEFAKVRFTETKEGFPRRTNRTASVVVRGPGSQPISRSTLSAIRINTAGWFGIDPKQVAITDQNGVAVAHGDAIDGLTPESRKYIAAKAYHEGVYREKIETALRYIGSGLITVVNVELDPTLTSETTKVTVDPQAVAVESDTLTKSKESRPPESARPGSVPNQVAGDQPRKLYGVNQQESMSEESREQQQSVTGHEQTHQVTSGLTPKTVTASVAIPRSHLKEVWLQEQLANGVADPQQPTPGELTQIEGRIIPTIESQVVRVLPQLEAGENQYPLVNVSVYQDIPVEAPAPPSLTSKALGWFSVNWKTLGLFAVGLVSLFVLRSMLKTTPEAETPQFAAPIADTEAEEEEAEQEEAPHIMLHRRNASSGMSLREELITLVREDPDAAANVLRTWIGDAA